MNRIEPRPSLRYREHEISTIILGQDLPSYQKSSGIHDFQLEYDNILVLQLLPVGLFGYY